MNDYLVYSFALTPMSEVMTEVLIALLAEEGFEGFEQTPTGIEAYIPAGETPQIPHLPGVTLRYTVAPLPHTDWNATWEQEGFQPIIVGSLCTIHKPSDLVDSTAVEYDILIEPCQAFGSGGHATTRMLVEQLLSTDLTGMRCLDMGCGTGILTICMALRHAAHTMAIDIDPDSVANARHNIALNGLAHADAHTQMPPRTGARVTVVEGDATAIEGVFDLIVANIHRNIILADMPTYVAHLAPGGCLLLSGFYADDAPTIIAAARTLGLQHTHTQTDDEGWTVVRGVKSEE